MGKVLIIYHSQEYKHTEAMAWAVSEGAREAGAEVDIINTHRGKVDIEAFRACDAVAIGSPDYYSYIAGGLKVFFDDYYLAKKENPQGLKDKPVGVFYSHGGDGKGLHALEALAKKLGPPVAGAVSARGKPDKFVLINCQRLGEKLAQAAE